MTKTRMTAMLTAGAVALSTAIAATASPSACERVVVEAQSSDHVEHTGTFYQVGTSLDDTPLFKSDGGFCLQFIEEGTIADEDYSTYMELYTGSESEPPDASLDTDLPTVAAEETFSRRFLQRCGYWVIGRMGPADTAMYPMLKVSDCADHPTLIDDDSSWFRQDCHDCDQELDIGYVTIFTESYECGSFTWAPAATPTPAAVDALPTVVETPPSPANSASETGEGGAVVVEPTTPAEIDGGEDAADEEAEDEEDRAVDLEAAAEENADNSSSDDGGVDGVAVGVGVGVGVAVLAVVAMVAFKKIKS